MLLMAVQLGGSESESESSESEEDSSPTGSPTSSPRHPSGTGVGLKKQAGSAPSKAKADARSAVASAAEVTGAAAATAQARKSKTTRKAVTAMEADDDNFVNPLAKKATVSSADTPTDAAAAPGSDLAAVVPTSEDEKLRAVWRTVDKDRSGSLDVQELHQVFKLMGQNLNEKQLAKAHKQLDKDGSGTIEFDEFDQWWRSQKEKARQRMAKVAGKSDTGKLQKVWEAVDADGSGTLDIGEVKEVFVRMGQNLSETQLAKAYKQLDADGSGKIEFREFEVWWAAQKAKAKKRLEGQSGAIVSDRARLRSVWTSVDKDGSGALNSDELKLVFVQMGQNLKEKQFAKAFKQLDRDGSGAIEFSEFEVWWKAQKEKARQRV
eukprot:SAG31_NODE_3208_length_4552_cov_5.626993_1_plen_378_part_00